MRDIKFLLIARGSSHIKYFSKIAENTKLDVSVVKSNKTLLRISDFKFWQHTSELDMSQYLQAHFNKKQRKFPMLSKRFIGSVYKLFSQFFTKLEIVKYCGIINRINSDVVGVWNGQKMPSANIIYAAKCLNKSVVYFENGLMPNSTVCDWQGVNWCNTLPKQPNFYLQYTDLFCQLPRQLVTTKPLIKASDSQQTLPNKYIFVPFQVETDSQIINHSPWISTMNQFWQLLVDVLEQCTDLELMFVIKEHPCEKKRFKYLHDKHPKVIFVNHLSTQQLIEGAAVVLTINSTVGIESLLFDKKLLVLGNAFYSFPGISQQITNTKQLIEVLNDLDNVTFDQDIRRGFLNFLHRYYLLPDHWQQPEKKHFDALVERLMARDHLSQCVYDAIDDAAVIKTSQVENAA